MTSGLWTVQVAGMPCTAQTGTDGDWVVTVASASVGRHENLTEAIMLATGGLTTRTEAETLATSIRARQTLRKLVEDRTTSRIGRNETSTSNRRCRS